jgi:RNA polymerase sigma-70 factor, ECF subfamily
MNGTRVAAVAGALPDPRERSFETLLDTLLDPGYRLACAMLQDPQAAEDAVQEASFKAWRKLGRLQAGRPLRPWFLGIVANECRSLRRGRWRSVLKWAAADGAIESSTDALLVGVDVRRALRRLDHGTRLAVVMRWYLDLPLDEIALATGASVHAVESRLQRGKKALRRHLQEEPC